MGWAFFFLNLVILMQFKPSSITQHTMAVALILSSIAIAIYQVIDIDNVNSGTLMYIAQAFLLAGSIFGLDYYVHKLTSKDTQK